MSYDYTDVLVANLVRNTHVPIEVSGTPVDPSRPLDPILLSLVCSADRNPWPCLAVLQLRAYVATNQPPVDPNPIPTPPVVPPRGRGGRETVAAADRVAELIADGKLRA